MAQMFPASLYPDDTRSRAEVKVYDAFRDQLGDDWDVFHSTSWTVRRGEKGSWDGEIDFVVSHSDHGFLCVEVKGGAVRFTSDGRCERKEKGSWVPYGTDPFDQAVGHTHALRRLINEMPGWRERRPLIGHAVSFPNISVGPIRMPPRAPRQIIIDRNDVREIEGAVLRAFAFHSGTRNEAPGDRGRQM